jgi:tRNA(fMet)-specific endonuclease VapC
MARLLKESARKAGRSVNAQVIEFVRRGLGLGKPHSGLVRHTDLDHLAGTWTEEEAEEFGRRIAEAGAVEVVQLADRLGFSTVVLGELLAGFVGGDREEANRRELAEFLASPRVVLLPVREATASHYADAFRSLRNKGRPVPTNDLWIAATAREHGFAIFTYDGHFAHVEGVLSGSRPEAFLP